MRPGYCCDRCQRTFSFEEMVKWVSPDGHTIDVCMWCNNDLNYINMREKQKSDPSDAYDRAMGVL